MSVTLSEQSVVVSSAQPVSLAPLFQVTPSASDPAYLVLNAFDRDEYTAASTGVTGSFNGATGSLGLGTRDGDARETGIVFQYQAATGRYFNASMGFLDQLTYTPSTNPGDITDLSLFGTASAHLANTYANDAIGLMQVDPGGFRGTVTIATEPGSAGLPLAQATPNAIAAIADGFIGQSWNMDGCWVLASAISAEAGASLPLQSTIDIAGQANGEWFVAYNGPAGSTADWQSIVRTGDIVGFVTGAGGGHITTCVAGVGSSALLVDNITYVDAAGHVINAANDGSANDVFIEAPHAASEEWSGVPSSSVVIYRLDTPVMAETVAALRLSSGAKEALSAVFSAADPAGRSVTEFQVYNSATNDSILVNGVAVAAESAASAATVAALSQVTLGIGAAGSSDTVTVRAFNGQYWGDWLSLAINSPAPAPTASTASTTLLSSAGTTSVYRFFDTLDGTHFFTASAAEREGLIATRPDLAYEGVGLNAIGATSNDPAAAPVFRFFDTLDGTHFFTTSTAERDSLINTHADLTFEGIAFYEHATQQSGDSAVYRFFDTAHGTHLYTENATERATILTTRPDLVAEGVAFYAPKLT